MRFSKEIKVGLLAAITLVVVYVGLNYLKGKDIYATTHVYYATYDNARGVNTANEVTINGFRVGRIQKVEILPEQTYQVRVTLAVDKYIKLTNNTVARLQSSLLGSKTIELVIKEGEPLKNHGTLMADSGQDLTAQLAASTLPAIDDARAFTLLLNKFMQNLIENTGRINTIFSNLEKTSAQLQQVIALNQKNFIGISSNLAQASSFLSDEEMGLKPLLIHTNRLLQKADALQVGEVIARIDNILARLETGLLHTNIEQTVIDLDKLVVDLKTNPSRYVHFSIFGKNSAFRTYKQRQPKSAPIASKEKE